MNLIKLFIASLLLVSCTPGARYTLHSDNDFFSPFKNEDRDFSNGVRFAMETPDETGSTSYYIGQQFYTPGKKQLTELQPNDRPYAGYLYGGGDYKFTRSERVQDVFGVTLGVVGEHSYSKETQNEFHRILNQKTAKGWSNQVHDEVGLILTFERNFVPYQTSNNDFILTGGGNLGNVYTQAYAGAILRYGRNLPSYFTSPQIFRPRLDRELENEVLPISYYLYGGPRFRLVARNIFLDGNTFRDSHSIDKEIFVSEGNLGFAVEYGLYRLAYTYIIQTAEFKSQKDGNDFGEVTLSIGW